MRKKTWIVIKLMLYIFCSMSCTNKAVDYEKFDKPIWFVIYFIFGSFFFYLILEAIDNLKSKPE